MRDRPDLPNPVDLAHPQAELPNADAEIGLHHFHTKSVENLTISRHRAILRVMIPVNWGSSLPWRWLELKIEEVLDRNSEGNGERFDGFERRGIEATFYKA